MKDRDLEAHVVRLLSAVYLDARQTNNSGAVSANGDVLAGPWLVDAKGSDKSGFNVTAHDLRKTRTEAWRHRREPLFVRSNGEHAVLACLGLDLLVEILHDLDEYRKDARTRSDEPYPD